MTGIALALGMQWFCRAAPGFGPAIRRHHHSYGDPGLINAILFAILLAIAVEVTVERVARWRNSHKDVTP